MLGGAGRYPPLNRSLGANHNSTITCYEPHSPNGEIEAGVPTAESRLALRLTETMVRVFRRGKGSGRGAGERELWDQNQMSLGRGSGKGAAFSVNPGHGQLGVEVGDRGTPPMWPGIITCTSIWAGI